MVFVSFWFALFVRTGSTSVYHLKEPWGQSCQRFAKRLLPVNSYRYLWVALARAAVLARVACSALLIAHGTSGTTAKKVYGTSGTAVALL